MSEVRIVLADDHSIVRQGLRAVLQEEPDFVVVDESGDGMQTVRIVQQRQPDVLVLDLMIPSLSGLEVAREVRRDSPQTKVVILSMYESEAYVSEAVRAGASAYVLKGSNAADLVVAVREVMAGRRFFSSPISAEAIESFLTRGNGGRLDRYETLTRREREVLQLAAEGHTSAGIAGRLFISPRTVEIHRAHMMRKLNLRSQSDLVRFAVARGLVSVEPEPHLIGLA